MAKRRKKSLFQMATESGRRSVRRAFGKTTLGRVVAAARKIHSGARQVRRAKEQLQRGLSTDRAKEILKDLDKRKSERTKPQRYSFDAETKAMLDQLLKGLGPFGEIILGILGAEETRSMTDAQLEAARELLRAHGEEILTAPGNKGFERGMQAAQELVETLGRGEGGAGAPAEEPGPTEPEEDWPDEHGMEIFGRGNIGWHPEETAELVSKEIRTPGSSNVWSFVYQRESKRTGILYVTFKAWTPDGGRMDQAGPTYAYYDVPYGKYLRFKDRTGSSAGKAVWDYLRQRGTVHGHQHPYRLVAGVLVAETGQRYVPRKATPRGYKRRAVPNLGVGRRGFTRSTLPPRDFRAQPNRGRPNTGRPNTGAP